MVGILPAACVGNSPACRRPGGPPLASARGVIKASDHTYPVTMATLQITSDPELASLMMKPSVMSVLMEIQTNPMAMTKYQSNPDVRAGGWRG